MAFFSGTDSSELHDNAGNYEYYLSLIVNFAGSYCAKIAFEGTVNRGFKLKNPGNSGEFEEVTEDMLILVDLDIVKESKVILPSETFQERYEKVKKEKEESQAITHYTGSRMYAGKAYGSYGGNYQSNYGRFDNVTQRELYHNWDDDDIEYHNSKKNKSKKNNIKDYPVKGKNGLIVSMSDSKFDEYLLDWFTRGLKAFEGLHFNVEPDTVAEAINVFDEYFEGAEELKDQLEYFITYMTKIAPDVFADINPLLVRSKGVKAMDSWSSIYNIATDLEIIFQSYPEYLIELENLKK